MQRLNGARRWLPRFDGRSPSRSSITAARPVSLLLQPESNAGRQPWHGPQRLSDRVGHSLFQEPKQGEFHRWEIPGGFLETQVEPSVLPEVFTCLEPLETARAICRELPAQYTQQAARIRALPGWEDVWELQYCYELQQLACKRLQDVATLERRLGEEAAPKLLSEITSRLSGLMQEQEEVTSLVLDGMTSWKQLNRKRDDSADRVLDYFLDSFMSSRIRDHLLLTQYLVLVQGDAALGGPTVAGIVDLQCAPVQVCREAADAVLDVCAKLTGQRPVVVVQGPEDPELARLPCVPRALRYIVRELLKNSCRATVEHWADVPGVDLDTKPINVEVTAESAGVMICVSDVGGGIPSHLRRQVWSYLFTTAGCRPSGSKVARATELAGCGVGLPMLRLYAKQLGGTLDFTTFPGHGTDISLFLPRPVVDNASTMRLRSA